MNILKMLRMDRGLLQKDMSAFLGVDRTTYVKYESGASEPPIAVLVKLADYFGVTIDYLVRPLSEGAICSAGESIEGDEMELLDIYRSMNNDGKNLLLDAARSFAGNPEMKSKVKNESVM